MVDKLVLFVDFVGFADHPGEVSLVTTLGQSDFPLDQGLDNFVDFLQGANHSSTVLSKTNKGLRKGLYYLLTSFIKIVSG